MNALPPGFQQAPVVQAFAAVIAERDTLLAALEQIANTDSRYGIDMKEAAADAVRQILETRIDARISARRAA